MPKFNKPKLNQPKVNKSKVNQSKFDDRPDQSKSLSSPSDLPPVQLDETIVAGRRPKPVNDFQRLLEELSELRSGFDPEILAHIEENIPFNAKQFETKISKILGSKNIYFSLKNSVKYLDYIKQNIQLPCHVTGIEEFEWEEEYTMGSGSKKEYARLKKTQPSYTDRFTINRLEDLVVQEEGIFVEVQRVGDRQKFMLPLSELESVDVISRNNQLLDDYAVWFLNY
ncbi:MULTISPECIES: calcium-binding protein [unclassified Microcoleus]|uniref:calcium-binding protein n=1 Tax=unclassified Microcoleus TaxID=2642155 RepID=UPI002FD17061